MLKQINEQPIFPKRVVVLGSQGFVGSHIIARLKQVGINVLGISRNQINLLEENATGRLLECLKTEDAVVIVSAIAPCKNNTQLLDNLRMIQAVCYILDKVNLSHIIYISSDAVYADDANPVTESSPVQPSSLHGLMHSARELMLKLQVGKIPLAILRPSLLYGLTDPHNGYGPNRYRRLIEEDKAITLFGNGEEKRDHIFIEDVAELVSLTLQYRSQGVLNIATGESLSFREIAELMVLTAQKTIQIQATPRQNPIMHRYFDITACYKAFPQFHYTPFKQGVLKLQRHQEKV